jgi:RNA polymerase sigma-70 factor (ECF subfamily)
LARLSDDALIAELQSGNTDAFAVIFDRFHRLVLVTALRVIRDAGEAEDVTQQVFLEIYRSAGQFDRSRGTLKVWVLQYAYHRSISRRNYLSLRRFYDQAGLDDVLGLEASMKMPVCPPTQETAHLISEAIALLPESQRKTVQMVFFEGLTLKEVAERNGQTFSGVRHHYYRGLDLLRRSLESGKNRSDASIISLAEVPRVEA